MITYFQFRNALFIVLLKYSPPLGVPLGVAFALTLDGFHHGQSVFLAQPISGVPDVGIALFVGNVLTLIEHIHGTKIR